ncbi:PilZ domain-containing protein [Pelagibius litoralis]|uniref:PilZ domain-containing protein n=1 Tax=Pelagibius litoralis TaxID=374515 RepID=A0A967C9B4_9PROT|nr:PilZ domain-containing protein [Pelagibius litoralis]NIA68977.1 PilZ domain-containing protein [Pelagibius litoralis]
MSSKVGPEHLRDFERRRSLRFVLPRQETITLTAAGKCYQGILEDVSIGGAKLRFADETPPPVDVSVEHAEAGEILGTCMWHDGECMGIAFTLTDSALRLISHCLRQGIPNNRVSAA